MGQWGASKEFKNDAVTIRVICHVDTGDDPFAPLTPVGTIDGVYCSNVHGQPQDARQLAYEVEQRFLNKPYSDWLAA